MNLIKNIKENVILLIGIAIRIVMPFFAYDIPQHDVWQNGGHFDYAMYILKNAKLADTNFYEFHQPPFNAIMQAIFVKIELFLTKINDLKLLYTYTVWLSVIYSILTFIIIKKIVDIFYNDNQISKFGKNFILAILSIYPGMLIMTVQLGNDGLVIMFFYLSLYLGISWFKNQKLSTIILLALSIGFGMLTKVSVGIIAFIIGSMMIYKLTKDKKILRQLIIFGLIVFPLGLSYEFRNYIKFGQLPGTIYEIAKGTRLEINTKMYSFIDRFISFPIDRLFNTKSFIYHSSNEWNVWIDLIKTATFDEVAMDGVYNGRIIIVDIIIYVLNIIYFVMSIISVIVCIIKKRFNKVFLLSISLFLLAIIVYIIFNVKYPYTCNTNWRYIPYITFAQALVIGLLFDKYETKKL